MSYKTKVIWSGCLETLPKRRDINLYDLGWTEKEIEEFTDWLYGDCHDD